eukprot:scaffold880_cov112-Isochrysis_galbana.AAC.1
MKFSGKFGVLIRPGSVMIPVDGRDGSLCLSAPSPNRRATSTSKSSRIGSPCSECVRDAVSGQNGAESDAEQ